MLGLEMRPCLGHFVVKAQALSLSMDSFAVHICWMSSYHGRDVARPGMLQFGVMNLCPSKLHSSVGLGKAGTEESSEEPDPTVLTVPLEGREHPHHASLRPERLTQVWLQWGGFAWPEERALPCSPGLWGHWCLFLNSRAPGTSHPVGAVSGGSCGPGSQLCSPAGAVSAGADQGERQSRKPGRGCGDHREEQEQDHGHIRGAVLQEVRWGRPEVGHHSTSSWGPLGSAATDGPWQGMTSVHSGPVGRRGWQGRDFSVRELCWSLCYLAVAEWLLFPGDI